MSVLSVSLSGLDLLKEPEAKPGAMERITTVNHPPSIISPFEEEDNYQGHHTSCCVSSMTASKVKSNITYPWERPICEDAGEDMSLSSYSFKSVMSESA